tara:strand:- start:1316 stop:1705 length:390 start_codon:yes stop_codon:yes gene_type:complete
MIREALSDPAIYNLQRSPIVAHDVSAVARSWGVVECPTYTIEDTTLRITTAIIDIDVSAEDDLATYAPPTEIIELIWTDKTNERDVLNDDTVTLCSDLELIDYTVTRMSDTYAQMTVVYSYHTELYYNY